jgi:anti-anti-sigma factor
VADTPPHGFTIKVSKPADDVSVVALSGELDLAGAPELSRSLSLLTGPGAGRVVVDLTRLAFIDSTGLRELLRAAKAIDANGGSLTLAGPRPNVQRLFDIVRLAETLSIEPSLRDALAKSTR